MRYEDEALKKPWLLWIHDPCQEGGWSVGGFDTQEEAIAAAKARHAQAEVNFQQMVEYSKNNSWPEVWTRENECYDGCIVTPGLLFRVEVELKERT